VRATVDNAAGLLKPEMFASVKILTGESDKAVAVPRDAIIYEGEAARVWVVRDKDSEKAIELRRIKVGLTNGNMVEVLKVWHLAIVWSPRAVSSSIAWRRAPRWSVAD